MSAEEAVRAEILAAAQKLADAAPPLADEQVVALVSVLSRYQGDGVP